MICLPTVATTITSALSLMKEMVSGESSPRRITTEATSESARFIFSPNVPRQVSMAGGVGESQETGAKALGLLFCQQALCLSAEPR